MQQTNYHIGCSGFSYREWKGVFYPQGLAQKEWFGFYAQHFNTLEINNTFYRFPGQKLFENWYAKAPDSFTFSVKVPKQITHIQKFRDTQPLLNDLYTVAGAGLREKLGPILFQLPPSMKYDEGLLQTVISQLNPTYKNVIEFRNASWWRADVQEALAAVNAVFCGVSYPGLPNDAVAQPPLAYYRLHGVPTLYYSQYDEAFLQRMAQQLAGSAVQDAYVYFNNTASGAALENAKYLQLLTGNVSLQG